MCFECDLASGVNPYVKYVSVQIQTQVRRLFQLLFHNFWLYLVISRF